MFSTSMAYKALYRTYRPSTFDEVAGQQHIVKTLKNALATGKIAHAYLFAGPRGTGKTTMAKLLAKALNCEEGVGCQCNHCKNCQSIIDGSHPDVLELDAASNNGVENIRELIDNVKYGTILGKYKIYIIDEVHMLSAGAFNALLKTLEEPPENVIFILATTEPHKILPTILSRCQRYDFTKVSESDTKARIKTILEQEKITYNDDAINLIVKLADGGMRDALSILDQVLAYSGNTLKEQDILDIFALESKDEKISLISAIAEGDTVSVMEKINRYVTKGSDIKRLTNDLLKILKDVLVYLVTKQASFFEALNEQEAQSLANELEVNQINEMISILLNALKEYKNVSDINPIFQITILRLAATKPNVTKTVEQEKPLFTQEQKTVTPKVEPKPVYVKPEPTLVEKANIDEIKDDPIPEIKDNIEEVEHVVRLKGATEGASYKINQDTMIKIMVTSKKDIKNNFLEGWKNIKRLATHATFGKYATLLIDAHPLVASNNMLVLEYPLPKMAEKVNLIENQKGLQTVIKAIFDRQVFIYGVSRKDSVDYQGVYRNLLEISKLPKANQVQLEFEEE